MPISEGIGLMADTQIDNYVYMMGGSGFSSTFNNLLQYDIENNTWETLWMNGSALDVYYPGPRSGASLSYVNDVFYLYGGLGLDNSMVCCVANV